MGGSFAWQAKNVVGLGECWGQDKGKKYDSMIDWETSDFDNAQSEFRTYGVF